MFRRSDYAYDLPPDRIAQAPTARRDQARLLVVEHSALKDRRFAELAALLPVGCTLVVNDTRVIPARLHTAKPTGGAVELLFLHPVPAAVSADVQAQGAAGRAPGDQARWRCMAKSSKAIKPGMRLMLAGAASRHADSGEAAVVVMTERAGDGTIEVVIEARGELVADVYGFLDRYGEIPLPPYIGRPEGTTATDAERYQTVYAAERGAVAAPTAGLHMTEPLLQALGERGMAIIPVTLHVGLGTFAPMRAEALADHRMHAERYRISEASAAALRAAKAEGRPIVAVGTTSVRALESAALLAAARGESTIAAGEGTTDLFIYPGFRFRVVDLLITNFHLPESTLLMMVCAFAGYDRVMAAYRHAVAQGYRFFSYGDAMLVSRAHDL